MKKENTQFVDNVEVTNRPRRLGASLLEYNPFQRIDIAKEMFKEAPLPLHVAIKELVESLGLGLVKSYRTNAWGVKVMYLQDNEYKSVSVEVSHDQRSRDEIDDDLYALVCDKLNNETI